MADFKLGCLPQDKSRPRLHFADVWTGIIPEVPAAADYLTSIGWNVLGNDRWGDCVAVACANFTRHMTARLGNVEDYPTLDEVLLLYKTQNPRFPADDNGMVIQRALDWWAKNTWSGRKLVAYASVDCRDINQIRAAIAIFGAVRPGVTVTSANMSQFNSGKSWDAAGGSGGGHAIVFGGYSQDSSKVIDFITWGKKTTCTARFIQNQCNECWVPILPEHLGQASFLVGINGQKLADAYRSLTGRELPIPPAPPAPPIPPAPQDDLRKQVADLRNEVTALRASVSMLAKIIGEKK